MELIRLCHSYMVAFLLFLILVSCSKESDIAKEHQYHYISYDTEVTAKQIADGSGLLQPKGIAILDDKLYVCNGDVLEVFNAQSLQHLKTINSFTKGETTIEFSNLTSIAVDSSRIYIGSRDSRLFVLDKNTNSGISVVGNGQWWQTFVHVFGVTVADGLMFVKEKENSIKVFDVTQITQNSNWDLEPIAKLNTVTGATEEYSMDVENGDLVVAGRNAEAFLYYNVDAILSGAEASFTTPITPIYSPNDGVKPLSVKFTEDWAITSEKIGEDYYLRLYPKEKFMQKDFDPKVSAYDVMGDNPFGEIIAVEQLGDRIFISDYTNQQIAIVKLKTSLIIEH
ncbi:hypothetical protein I215_11714 [Galbibacter marinus]|uniref:Lipoprotein n=1 Tax=Galbibacter marinus TaxID=555500 RepID=K2PSR6_9FLAO|nr:hypothetical protein [Galbibacter marinus]EKF54624.1 hypothetical protein I215_11714 [Galbibacter marinus]